MAQDKISVEITHVIKDDTSSASSSSAFNNDALKLLKNISDNLSKSYSKTASATENTRRLTAAAKAKESTRVNNLRRSVSSEMQAGYKIWERLDKSKTLVGGKQLEGFYKNISNLNTQIAQLSSLNKKELEIKRQAVRENLALARQNQTIQMLEGTYNPKRRRLVSTKDLASGAALALLGKSLYSAEEGLVQYAGTSTGTVFQPSSQLAQYYVGMQNQVRKSIATGASAALVGVGTAIGAAVAGPLGATLGAAITSVPAMAINAYTASDNTLHSGALTFSQLAARAHLMGVSGAERLTEKTAMSGTSAIGQSLTAPVMLSSQMLHWQKLNESGKDTKISIPTAASAAMAYARYGLPLSDAEARRYTTLGVLGYQTDQIAAAEAFIRARTGMAAGNLISAYGISSGMGPEAIAAGTMALMQGSDLYSPRAAASLLSSTAPYGSSYQNTALGFHQAGPTAQFQRRMMAESFGINLDQLYGSNNHQRNVQLMRINNLQKRLGSTVGPIVTENLLGGAQNYYAVMGAAQQVAREGLSANTVAPAKPFSERDLEATESTEIKKSINAQNLTIQHATIEKVSLTPGMDTFLSAFKGI